MQSLFSAGGLFARCTAFRFGILRSASQGGDRGGLTMKKLLETLYVTTPESHQCGGESILSKQDD